MVNISLNGKIDRSRPVAMQVQTILRDRILKMELVPGTVLSRSSLQLEFGISQTPVRDALMRLQEEGLVDVYPQYATVVSRIDMHNARQAQFQRLSIELEAVRQLTATSPKETAEELSQILAQQRSMNALETFDAFDEADRAFHRKLYERQDILQLWDTVRRQSIHIDRLRRLNLPMPGKIENILQDHQAIVDALASGNPDRAADAVRKHLSGTLSMIDVITVQYPDYII